MLSKALQIASANAGQSPIGGLFVNTTSTINITSTTTTNFDTSPNFYYDWVVPIEVTSISAVAVGGGAGGSGSDGTSGGAGGGGGALSYSNNVAVVPGETLRVYVGRGGYRTIDSSNGPFGYPSGIVRLSDSSVLLKAVGGVGVPSNGSSPGDGGAAASGVGQVRFSGGIGGTQGSSTGGGGGGASGYSADGNTGLGGSGNFGGNGNVGGLGGGGVGLFGEGASGTGSGQGGSGGGSGGTSGSDGGPGGLYGGGGGGGADESGATDFHGGQGAGGAVRIIWGSGRSFPATKTSFADSDGNEITIARN